MARLKTTSLVFDVALIFALKIALALWLVHAGLVNVSDDDFARAVIAEQFAHAPRLDPSGTSWLPFPFWITGGAMMLFGRWLMVARAVSIALGALGAMLLLLALRAAGVARSTAFAGTVVAMATPWNACLGAAAVPEGFTGAFVAAAAIATVSERRVVRAWMNVALVCASLSRYEVWPACLLVTANALRELCAARASMTERTRNVALALVPMVGPLAWMAWNLHAHGSATHFLARVAAYRHAIGVAGAPLAEKLLLYPRALLGAPEIALVALFGAAAFALDRRMRARWTLPWLVCFAVLAFLVYGETKEGAPTHHPERALVAIWWISAPFGIDGVHVLADCARRRAFGGVGEGRGAHAAVVIASAALLWIAIRSNAWRAFPLEEPDARRPQIASGEALRTSRITHFAVTPCAYEHFALIAAYGAPESVEIRPATHATVTEACPRVELPSP